MGWWGFTFPLGVYTVATTTLAKDIPSLFFKILGTIFSVLVILLWLGVSVKTIQSITRGKLFLAPCVETYQRDMARKAAVKKDTEN